MAGLRNNYSNRSNRQSDFTENGYIKRRSSGDDADPNGIGAEDTVYRYLCPVRKVGSIIGKGGEIAKELRSVTKSSIRIGETLPGCDERVVTIHSTSEETNAFGEEGELVSPALDALFEIHDRIVAEDFDADEIFGETQVITVRMLVPSDQIGCIIGKGGQVIQNLRSRTRASIRVLDEYLPACALSHDELLQIIGEPSLVRKALYEVAELLQANPSRFQHQLLSSSLYQPGGILMAPPYSSGTYFGRKDEADPREFSLCFVCPVGNVGGVIGKGGHFINQIRQESGASIKVDSSSAEGDDCTVLVSSMEFFEDPSAAANAALSLQPRCSEKVEKDSGDSTITTRLLVPSSQVGCLIGKGGGIISDMRRLTKANIRILQRENLPEIAREHREIVQISGGLDVARKALSQVILRLRANMFERDGAVASHPALFPYISLSGDVSYLPKIGKRNVDSRIGGGGSRDPSATRTYGRSLIPVSRRRNYGF